MPKDTELEARTNALIASAERLVAEANAVMATTERFFADHHIDREALIRALEARQGKGAYEKIQAEVARSMAEAMENARREQQRKEFDMPNSNPAPRRKPTRVMI